MIVRLCGGPFDGQRLMDPESRDGLIVLYRLNGLVGRYEVDPSDPCVACFVEPNDDEPEDD